MSGAFTYSDNNALPSTPFRVTFQEQARNLRETGARTPMRPECTDAMCIRTGNGFTIGLPSRVL